MDKPPIRILQRPCSIPAIKSEVVKPPSNFKTLEQREADYAAARRRIMGSESADDGGDYSHPVNTEKEQIMNFTTGVNSAELAIAEGSTDCVPSVPVDAHSFGNPVLNVAQNIQQPQDSPSLHRQQPQRITPSASSPSFFAYSRNVHAVPLFPQQVGSANNHGLLPTPPNVHSLQGLSQNAYGVGFSHTQPTAAALMHHFNSFQQHYQNALNGIQAHLMSGLAHTNASHGHVGFSFNALPNTSQKHAHSSTFN